MPPIRPFSLLAPAALALNVLIQVACRERPSEVSDPTTSSSGSSSTDGATNTTAADSTKGTGPERMTGPNADSTESGTNATESTGGETVYPLSHSPNPLFPSNGFEPLNPVRAYLYWQDGIIPEGFSTWYRSCHDTALVNITDPQDCPDELVSTNRFRIIDSLVPDQDYFWKVQTCYDETGIDCTGYSEPWSFSTDNSVVSRWEFNGNFNDASGNGHHASALPGTEPVIISGGAMCNGFIIDEVIASAACFDGATHFLTVSDADPLDAPPAMIEMRLQPTTPAGILLDKMDGALPGGLGYTLELADGNGRIAWAVDNMPIGFSHMIPSLTWTHLFLSHEDLAQNLYVGPTDTPVESAAATVGIGANALDLTIGVNINGVEITGFYPGVFDFIVITNRGLTVEERFNNACAAAALANPDLVPSECTP